MPISYFLQALGLILCALSTAMMLGLSWAVLWCMERGQAPGAERAPALGQAPALGRGQAVSGGPAVRGVPAVNVPVRLKRMETLPPGYHRGVRHKRKGRRALFGLDLGSHLRAAFPLAAALMVVWLMWVLMGGLARIIANGGGDWLVGVSQWVFPR